MGDATKMKLNIEIDCFVDKNDILDFIKTKHSTDGRGS